MSAFFDSTNNEPIAVEGGLDERGLLRYDVTWVAATRAAAWSLVAFEFEGLKRKTARISGKPGSVQIVGSYEGLMQPGTGGIPAVEDRTTYELDTSLMQKPIINHPRIKSLEAEWGKVEEQDNGIITFPRKAPGESNAGGSGAGDAAPPAGEDRDGVSPLYGVTEYVEAGAI
jgi:hypothetical protein